MSDGAGITLDGVTKRYDNGLLALEAVDLALPAGSFTSIVGPSGCGKSTLLRIIAGMVEPSEGQCRRGTGMPAFVFQEPALLPWRTVDGNVRLLMELERWKPPEQDARATEVLRQVGLADFGHAYPHELSGGMRMRLSLARALALRPDLLLLDEPLAAVDELTRDLLQEQLSQLWRQAGCTGVLVTHNVQEALFLSQRVVVMAPRPGRVVQVFDVPFPFPRAPELRASPAFAALSGQVSATLRASTTI
ncbi:ABC transporter ATP-binding protein [Pseudoduganella lutea]|uniref:ABC transporter ATP-binding protein n=1 Tax=Pseudoduganella lutea TaxID=321985 RepID=A0A4P6L4F8_9BURK|nr:ABC transporter ATP-binding protein [Pseudoduganella lutea]QBE65712.1 ABC transporter ATP-binding protein [Pseudoduganella lutea]